MDLHSRMRTAARWGLALAVAGTLHLPAAHAQPEKPKYGGSLT